jgi:hypothetical protein
VLIAGPPLRLPRADPIVHFGMAVQVVGAVDEPIGACGVLMSRTREDMQGSKFWCRWRHEAVVLQPELLCLCDWNVSENDSTLLYVSTIRSLSNQRVDSEAHTNPSVDAPKRVR